MNALDLMTAPAITCHVNDPLNVAAHRMWEADIGALPVVNDEGRLIGMITDRDICMAAYTRGRPLDELLVNRAMATMIYAATPNATPGELEDLMTQHQVHRIPIIDAAGKPVGMVSLNDLAIESVRPKTDLKHGPSKIAHTLAAICAHREAHQQAM